MAPALATKPEFGTLPSKWVYRCRALECAMNVGAHAESPGLHWYKLKPDYVFDVAASAALYNSCSQEGPAPETCTVEADLDGDGKLDRVTPILHETEFRPGFAVGWGDGRSSTVGTDEYGHLEPARGFSGCAESLLGTVARYATGTAEQLTAVESTRVFPDEPGPYRRSALRFPEGAWVFFDGARWRVANPELRGHEAPLPDASPWVEEGLSARCSAARVLRKRSYRSHEALMWHPSNAVARDACTHVADFDGDGEAETVSWVVEGGNSGIQIEGFGGRRAVFGAGRGARVEVLEGEPGCNEARLSFDDVWDLEVAPWTGTSWRLPDGRTHTPTHPELVDGPALALTNAHGHLDLLLLSKGTWRVVGVSFEWDRHFVFWPAMDQWNWVAKPPPAMRRYQRPSPAHKSWVKIHTPGPRPKAGRFYPGK